MSATLSVARYASQWDGKSAEGRARPLQTCTPNQWLAADQVTELQVVAENESILYTYDVIWMESDTKWASRWDIYLSMGDRVPARIHWFSIINSLLIIFFLSALVGMILIKVRTCKNRSICRERAI